MNSDDHDGGGRINNSNNNNNNNNNTSNGNIQQIWEYIPEQSPMQMRKLNFNSDERECEYCTNYILIHTNLEYRLPKQTVPFDPGLFLFDQNKNNR